MPRQLGLVERARIFAICRHAGQFREHKAHQPFIIHPKEVYEFVRNSGGSEEEEAASWVHDTVEDTQTTLDEIEKELGLKVREIVDGLTDPPEFKGLPLLVRKARQAERVRLKSASIKRVKLADQIVNVRSLFDDAPVTWTKQKCRDYAQGARLVAMACKGVDDFLDAQFELAYAEVMKYLEN